MLAIVEIPFFYAFANADLRCRGGNLFQYQLANGIIMPSDACSNDPVPLMRDPRLEYSKRLGADDHGPRARKHCNLSPFADPLEAGSSCA